MADKAPPRRKREVWYPASYTVEDIRAIQALALYAQASDGQEAQALVPSPSDVKRALDWIILTAAQTYEEPFSPGKPDVGHYMMGRASVGRQIAKLMVLKPEMFEKKDEI